MERVQRSMGQKALFTVTDPRSLMTLVAGLFVLFGYSVAMGYRSEVIYPWNAPRQVALPPAVVDTDFAPDVREATPLTTEAVSDPVRDAMDEATEEALAAAEAMKEAERAASEAEPQPTTTPTPPVLPKDDPVEQPASTPVSTPVSTPAPAPIDLSPLTARLEALESAVADERAQPAQLLLLEVERLAATIQAPELSSGGTLRRRIDTARDGVALLGFEEDILAVIQVARSAQETGDYPAAIGALNALVARAASAPAGLSNRMVDRLDFYRVEATADNLLEACQFERTNLGRTDPCTRR